MCPKRPFPSRGKGCKAGIQNTVDDGGGVKYEKIPMSDGPKQLGAELEHRRWEGNLLMSPMRPFPS